jgi:arylsulfatase
MIRFHCSAITLTLVLLLAACGQTDDAGTEPAAFRFPERPNVVLVLVDALRRDHLGAYGYDKPTTPFLDALASEGLLADDAWAQAPQTFVSTATLLTSREFPLLPQARFQSVPGIDDELLRRYSQNYLHDTNQTLAEVLKEAGYATFGAFTNPHHHPRSGFEQGFEKAVYLKPRSGQVYASAVDVHRAFFEWLDERQDSRPFFAYLHFMEVHSPYQPPRRLAHKFLGRKGPLPRNHSFKGWVPSAEELVDLVALYDGEIRFVDGVVEASVEELRRRELWGDTLFVLTSDHGDEFMDHGGLGHGTTLYGELLHIPILLAGAGLAGHPSAGTRLTGIVRNLDLAPTLVDVVGATVPSTFQGTSFHAAMEAATLETAADTFSFASLLGKRSLTGSRWHFMLDVKTGEKHLYDRVADPDELVDVAAEHPELVRRLARRIATLEKERQEVSRLERALELAGDGGEMSPDIVRQLRSLGYLDR